MSLPDIDRLNREWERLRNRYHVADTLPEVERLQRGLARRQAMISHLQSRIKELNAEIRVLEAEMSGTVKALGLVLGEAIHELRCREGEGWSPFPVLGFRLWDVRRGLFQGYRERWVEPRMTARCPTTDTDFEVPHTDGRCGDPPCGIYAAKDVDALLEAHDGLDITEIAVGLVAMTGKVVEHERGYRAERVSVLAVALTIGGVLRTFAEEEELESLFSGGGLEASSKVADPSEVRAQMVRFMREQREVRSQWTLASPNG